MTSTANLLRTWTARLRQSGVPSPEHDVRRLAAEVLGVGPVEIALITDISAEQRRQIADLVSRRAAREPLQHILGSAAFIDLDLEVGPGVFVPRPETESLAAYVVSWLSGRQAPQLVVDLCTGSGALALAIATQVPQVQVVGVELSTTALDYARRNLDRCRSKLKTDAVKFVAADATDVDLLPELSGEVDLVVSNPPYIPNDAVPRDPEVAEYDPPMALYGGADGLDVVRDLLPVAHRLLRPRGLVAFEHGELQGGSDGVPGALASFGRFDEIQLNRDLADRPRFTTAVRRD